MSEETEGQRLCLTVDDIFANPNNAQFAKKSIICIVHQQLFIYFSNTQSVIIKIPIT